MTRRTYVTRRVWVKHHYFRAVEVTTTCPDCRKPFTYTKTSRPRVRCQACQRAFKLERMRVLNAGYRRLEKERLGISV
jgi:LSD1 subclass zinc finger protein